MWQNCLFDQVKFNLTTHNPKIIFVFGNKMEYKLKLFSKLKSASYEIISRFSLLGNYLS